MTDMITPEDAAALRAELRRHQNALYHRARGGWPVALSGALYWAVLGILGLSMPLLEWRMAALWGGAGLLGGAWAIARLSGSPLFTKAENARNAFGGVTVAGMLSLYMVFVMMFAVERIAVEAFPLLLAVAVSVHWPVFGWTYGKLALYGGQALMRVLACCAVFVMFPEHRTTLIPLVVTVTYIGVVAVMLWQTRGPAATVPAGAQTGLGQPSLGQPSLGQGVGAGE